MKILLAGDGHAHIHEQACAAALRSLGHDVTELYWSPRFKARLGIGVDEFRSFGHRLQNKLIAGPVLSRFNRDLADAARGGAFDLLITYRGTHVFPSTLKAIRSMPARPQLVSINNDDPFSPGASPLLWRHFRRGIPHYDVSFVYRHRNIDDYRAAGAREVHLLRSWFLPERNFPRAVTPEERAKWGADVVFIGHFEADGRLEAIEALVRAGIDVRVYGFQWDEPTRRSAVLRDLPAPLYLGPEMYNLVLNASKIALSFFSTLNRDTYTRRCFEIPASGTLLMCQYSDDMTTLFTEGVEAEYFRDRDELVAKVRRYLDDDAARSAVARAGRRRVVADGHDVVSRMRQLLERVEVSASARGVA